MTNNNNLAGVIGRYARYKVSTELFITSGKFALALTTDISFQAGQEVVVKWLAKTAAQYRDLATLLHYLKKLKPSSRNNSVRINTQELIVLATTIANGEPPATVPAEILGILDHVIAGR